MAEKFSPFRKRALTESDAAYSAAYSEGYDAGTASAPRGGVGGWKVFFISLAAVFIGLLAIPFILVAIIGAWIANLSDDFTDPSRAEGAILRLDLRQSLTDHPAAPPLFGLAPASVTETARAIRHAADDADIEGIFIRAGYAGMAPASAEEIADALSDFKASGKFVLAHAQGLENPTLTSYSPLAPAEIWMQAGTGFAVAGIQTESEYYRGVFDKIDADPEFVQFHEYKSAADTYDETGMTEPVRQATEAWVGSVYTEHVADIARVRGLTPASVDTLLRGAPYTAAQAVEAGLADRLGYLEDARIHARELAGDADADFVDLDDYALANLDNTSGSATVALIGGQGPIVPGTGNTNPNPFDNAPMFGSDTIARAFDKATEDDDVKAIVFRVSSPGGSAAASAQIDAALRRAQAAGKPVIVSMGQYAASGGYYVSANADRIFALPSTITGSIGVLGGKVALEGTFDRIGFNIDSVTAGGDYAGAYSANTPFTDYQREAFTNQMSEIYDDFTQLVATGRGLPLERVQAIARGRVWTGAQALELGLVDELGDLDDALVAARLAIDLDADEPIKVKVFPKPPTFEEQLERLFSISAQARADLATVSAVARTEEVKAILRAREAMNPEAELRRELSANIPRILD